MEFLIREASSADVDGVVRVIRTVYDEYGFLWDAEDYHSDLYDLDTHYKDQGHTFWVAETADSGIVGTIALERFDRLPGEVGGTTLVDEIIRAGGADCSVERLYVHPDGRRGGLGRALMLQAMETARAEGRTALELWSDKKFEDAHRLYGKLGATIVGDRLCHDPDQSPEWGLVIKL